MNGDSKKFIFCVNLVNIGSSLVLGFKSIYKTTFLGPLDPKIDFYNKNLK